MITKDFILGGSAIFTIEVPEDAQKRSGAQAHYTFRISSFRSNPDDEKSHLLWSVALLAGPDNTKDYQYVGMLDPSTGDIRATKKSRFPDSSPMFKLIRWFVKRIWKGEAAVKGWEAHHEGQCARCGRKLTTPESIERGFGPECWQRKND